MAEKKTTYIRPQAGFQEEFVRSNVDVVFGGGTLGSGKAQPIDSLVCTPFGFRKMGDLKVGDKISSTNGFYETVIQIHERGELDVVELTFSDGRKVQCAKDHLWKARRIGHRPKWYDISMSRENLWRVMTTEEIISILDANYQNKVFIPLSEPIQFTKGCRNQGITIHPYLMGCLLGDGCFSESLYSPMLTTEDEEMVEKIRSLGYNIHNTPSNPLSYFIYDKDVVKSLKQKKLWGKLSDNKFIPECYKTSYIEDRWELVRGLLDTDGTISEDGHVEYYTISKSLCDDLVWVIRSLGGYASVGIKQGKYKKNGELHICKKCYRVSINIKDKQNLFSLSRKKERVRLDKYRGGGSDEELAIVSYRMLPKTQMRCITVSNPNNLYLTNDFVVTHNSYGAVLATAEPSSDSNFRALFLRNNLGDLRSGGGLLDNFRDAFGDYVDIVESGEPRVTFPSGARIDVTHVSDQTREKVLQRFKGRQYDLIYFDELTGFTWECFAAICTRNRGKGKWTGKIRGTTNPERNHWLRIFLDWYIGADGFIREDRAGVVRYFYMAGETVKDVVWGDSKEEVYAKCRIDIDRKLAKINGKTGTSTYENLIKSFTFYLGKMSENKAMLGNNDDYVGSVAMMGGRNAQQMLEGNWNVSPEEDEDAVIPPEYATQCFMNDPQTNGDRWITCDLADTGTDNFIALAWDGFHVIDMLIVGLSTPRQNAEMLHNFAVKHNIADSHIIYDAIRGTYINDYIKDAVQFVSYRAPLGMYGRAYVKLKDECYGRLVEAIKRGGLSFADELQNRRYEHANLNEFVSVENEFIEECSVVRYDTTAGGKKTLWSKKKMNQKLGKSRSMDLLDPCAMRMLPVLEYPYGEELIKTSALEMYNNDFDDGFSVSPNMCNIFDNDMFC